MNSRCRTTSCSDPPLQIIVVTPMLHEAPVARMLQAAHVPFDRVVLETLSDVGAAFTAERQLDPVLDRLLGTALQVVRVDARSVMLLSRERDTDTVKDHVQSIIKKFGATDRTHAAVIAVRGGLVS